MPCVATDSPPSHLKYPEIAGSSSNQKNPSQTILRYPQPHEVPMSFFRLELAALTLLAHHTRPAQTAQMPRDYRGVEITSMASSSRPSPMHPSLPRSTSSPTRSSPTAPSTSEPPSTTSPAAHSGRIYNERRQLVPATFKGEPRLPLWSYLRPIQPPQHLLRPSYPPRPRNYPAAASTASRQRSHSRTPPNNPYFKQEDIGTRTPRRSHPHRHS